MAPEQINIRVKEAQAMAQKIIDHLDVEHITSLALLETLLGEFLDEIKMLKEINKKLYS